jgi:hypothetical protein
VNLITRLFLVLSIAAMAGCAMVDKSMSSWMGHDQSDLIASWGPPQQIMDDGQGGKIFVYASTRSFTTPGSATTTVYGTPYAATAYTTYRPPQTSSYNASRMFWIDQNGRVYRWAWKGL